MLKHCFLLLLFSIVMTSCGNGRQSGTCDLSGDNAECADKWIYENTTDPMTDKTVCSARIYSNEQHCIDGGETSLCISIQSLSETVVLMGLGSWCKFRSNAPLLYYRIDGGEVETQSYMATANNIIYIGGIEWVERLKKARKLAVEIELADGGTQAFTFDVDGLQWD